MSLYIVMTATAKKPSSCRGRYGKIAVVETDGVNLPKAIDIRHNTVKRIAWCRNMLHQGKTARCAFNRALVTAHELCDRLNKEEQKKPTRRPWRPWPTTAVTVTGSTEITRRQKTMPALEIHFTPKQTKAIYADEYADLLHAIGFKAPERASDVNAITKGPNAWRWLVDMSPLGEDYQFCLWPPCDSREQALAMEHEFIQKNWLDQTRTENNNGTCQP